MSSYPNIRMYDNDPRSPFYAEPPTCEECEEELEQDIDCDDYGYYVSSSICTNMDCVLNNEEDKDE